MKNITFVFLAITSIISTTTIAQEYEVDAGHSTVLMSVQRFGVVNVIGRIGDINTTIKYNPEAISETTLTAPIEFTTSQIITRGEEMYLMGDFTFHGLTKVVALPFEIVGLRNLLEVEQFRFRSYPY